MDAVSETREYIVYFGGSYTEHWTEDYTMSVRYHDRSHVTARSSGAGWEPVGDNAELIEKINSNTLYRQYFNAAATAYGAAQECLRRGLTLYDLPRIFRFQDNPLTAPELMRLLMDDCGFGLDKAFEIAAQCCCDVRASGIDEGAMLSVQPRTSHVVHIMRQCAVRTLIVRHDCLDIAHRSPFGAVKTGEHIRLGFELISGSIKSAGVIIYGDSGEKEHPLTRIGSIWSASVAAPDTPEALWYRFRLVTDTGVKYICPQSDGLSSLLCDKPDGGFRLTVYDKDFETPAWFRRSIMYQVYPDRFAFSDDGTAQRGIEYHRALGQTPDLHTSIDEPVKYLPRAFEKDYTPDDFYGGTLRGIISKLDYLVSLGVSCLYLNPIVEARSNHRYDTSDYMKVDPILGTNGDFEVLCKEAQARGIRVILDGVFSHTGCDSVYFNRYGNYPTVGACQGKASDYYSWYDFRHFPDDYRCWWGFKDLPEVDELNPDWQEYVVSGQDSVVKTWLRRGASGWRLDVADELPDEALALIRKSAKEEKSDAPIIGEVWEDAVIKESYGGRRNYALGYSLDSVMNYPFRTAVMDFLHFRTDAFDLAAFLTGQQINYPQPFYYSLMNLIGSHDVERVRSALAVDVVIKELTREAQMKLVFTDSALERAVSLEKLAAVLQFVLPGVPSIYYGDEQGMCGVGDPFNRAPFREGLSELKDFYAGLAKLRGSTAILSTGDMRVIPYSHDVLMIKRYVNHNEDVFGLAADSGAYLIVINRGTTPVRYSFESAHSEVSALGYVIEKIM